MAGSGRILSIDVMRGLTLALMIVVNMSLSDTISYSQLNHAAWNGLTLTDLVFPTFLFVVGTSLSMTLPRLAAAGNAALLGKVLRRTALIFLCGYLLYWFPFFKFDAARHVTAFPISETRVLGVLQRIALGYGIAALLVHFGGRRAALWYCAIALPLYACLLGCFGDMTMLGNAVLRLDLKLFGAAHLYHGEGVAFDPEGLLSTLPAVVNVLAGYFAGEYLVRKERTGPAVAALALAGGACVLLALAWSPWLPFNKKLWTSSYALCAIGIDLYVLALLTQWFDVQGRRGGSYFFEVLGRNTLFIYLLSEVGNGVMWLAQVHGTSLMVWLYEQVFRPLAGVHNGALLYALAYLGCCWLGGWLLDRKQVYIRL
jgi:predicted acyltransferase